MNTLSFRNNFHFARGASMTALGVALMVGFGATAASAQDAAEAPADEIIVTGFRASIESSIKAKKNEVQIVEAITAEDIGKLPDVSIAESIARLPGLTAQRVDGRGQKISVRGLGPEFSTTLINGREQVTTGYNRGAEYDQYPSELFNQVVVYKSGDAGLMGEGLASTVDMRSIRPLDIKDRILSVQARGEMNGKGKLNPDAKRSGYRFSGTYADKFADDTIGVSLGVAFTETPTQGEYYEAWGHPTDSNGDIVLGGLKPYVQSNLLKRFGIGGAIDYRPSSELEVAIDGFYTKFKEKQWLRGVELPLFPGWGGATSMATADVQNGVAETITYTGMNPIQRNDYTDRDAKTYAFGFNTKYHISDKLRLTLDASLSHAERTDFKLENYTGLGYRGAGRAADGTIVARLQSNGTYKLDVSGLDFDDPTQFKITDPGGWGWNGTTSVVQAGFYNQPSFKDDLKALRAEFEGDVDMGMVQGWEVGAYYSRREKKNLFYSEFLCPKTAGEDCTTLPTGDDVAGVTVPADAILPSVAMDYLGIPALLTYDPLYVYNNMYNHAFDDRPQSQSNRNTLVEKVLTGYAKLKLDGEMFGAVAKGNVGVKFVHTKQSMSGFGYTLQDGVVSSVPLADSDSYTYALPTLNLALEVGDSTFVKFAAGRSMSRAPMDQLKVSSEININPAKLGSTDPTESAFSGKAGNVKLRPYIADGVDISFEKYFGGAGYFALAGFYKHLTNYIGDKSELYDFSAASSLLSDEQAELVGTYLGYISTKDNNGKGSIKGVEVTLSTPFSMLTPALDGFGTILSGSYTDSKIRYEGNANAIRVPGLSKWVANATLYFEKGGFEARGSYRYRSGFLGEVQNFETKLETKNVKAEGILDVQLGYNFGEGALKGLSLVLQGQNMTNEPYVTTNSDTGMVINHQSFGRTYLLGFNYKF